MARLKQVKGVGTLIALTCLLTVEDPQRFRKSRDVGCYVGLQTGRRNSGQSEPQLHISKEGDPYLKTLLVQGAHHILGPFGADRDLRRWGLKLAERGGKNGKKRAVIATARKLAALLQRKRGGVAPRPSGLLVTTRHQLTRIAGLSMGQDARRGAQEDSRPPTRLRLATPKYLRMSSDHVSSRPTTTH